MTNDAEALNGQVFQIAFVTVDIRAEMERMTRNLNVGPWFLRERGVFPHQTYRGQPTDTTLAIAMGYAGGTLFELIQQLDDTPSVYRDVVAQKGYGLHHFGVEADDYVASCARYASEGFDLVYEAEVANNARVGYFDTHGAMPAMIEVIEMLPATRKMFSRFREAAENWDGSDPVRPLAPVS